MDRLRTVPSSFFIVNALLCLEPIRRTPATIGPTQGRQSSNFPPWLLPHASEANLLYRSEAPRPISVAVVCSIGRRPGRRSAALRRVEAPVRLPERVPHAPVQRSSCRDRSRRTQRIPHRFRVPEYPRQHTTRPRLHGERSVTATSAARGKLPAMGPGACCRRPKRGPAATPRGLSDLRGRPERTPFPDGGKSFRCRGNSEQRATEARGGLSGHPAPVFQPRRRAKSRGVMGNPRRAAAANPLPPPQVEVGPPVPTEIGSLSRLLPSGKPQFRNGPVLRGAACQRAATSRKFF